MTDRPRTILVTGAASGIGAACCRALAGPGTAILVHTRKNAAGADAVAEAVRAAGGVAEVMLGDIADPALPAALVAHAQARFGGLDVVVANAGFADRTPVAALTDAGFAQSMDTVLWAFLRLARAALPVLAQGRGEGQAPRLVAISSFVAHVFRTDATLFPATAAAKAGVEALVRALAVEAAASGTTVNAVAPGFTQKDASGHSAMTPAQWDAVRARIPLGRLGTPGDVAQAVAFLASPGAAYITGQVLHVNGGLV
ncbi:SDR family NAD(P)-dependent oxidoreductase [Falsiroseomonas sp.]|uniref:SDR family NAD(P)-dependent oxidoreductase n=1 Tax=Falsiroseomonas sp. TaxID=2870721 RepID=UPI002725C1AF|nr:SDR family NAD(P)-dependent oxidoreductase [Falsiroseomonas sp.]MDO9500180.1 SDR family NAD(P)-dependent oxidoreductase [Falsiroseomonas sp.]